MGQGASNSQPLFYIEDIELSSGPVGNSVPLVCARTYTCVCVCACVCLCVRAYALCAGACAAQTWTASVTPLSLGVVAELWF